MDPIPQRRVVEDKCHSQLRKMSVIYAFLAYFPRLDVIISPCLEDCDSNYMTVLSYVFFTSGLNGLGWYYFIR